jgi:diaminopimelate epimerase
VVCGRSDNKAKLILRGGELLIEWDREADLIYMTGPASYVFSGELLM